MLVVVSHVKKFSITQQQQQQRQRQQQGHRQRRAAGAQAVLPGDYLAS